MPKSLLHSHYVIRVLTCFITVRDYIKTVHQSLECDTKWRAPMQGKTSPKQVKALTTETKLRLNGPSCKTGSQPVMVNI